jgi:membrane protein DedA with SNARE-associated domain
VLWVALWASVGDLAGQHLGTIYSEFTRYSLFVLIALAAAILAVIGRHLARRRAARAAKQEQNPA